MRFRAFICAAVMALTFSATAFGAEHTAQVVSFSLDADAAVELTGSKVITDDFSFKMPDGWSGNCIMVPGDSSYEIYDKTLYEEDGSGLLFSITCYEDVDYKDLEGCSILGLYDNKTYVLEAYYDEYLEDSTSREYKACKEATKVLKKSFVSFVKEPTE